MGRPRASCVPCPAEGNGSLPRTRKKLVVVANRGPYRATGSGQRKRLVRAAGGLVAALDPVLRKRGGLWVSAQDTDAPLVVEAPEDIGYDLAQVELSRGVQESFYSGVSNAILWPLMHGFPPTVRIGEAPWDLYVAANEAFSKTTLAHSKPSDLIWLQDFHLMLMPGMLRRRRRKARIGWFCHIPWPGPDHFQMLPWGESILHGLLGADVLGFHTRAYARNFMHCLEGRPGIELDSNGQRVFFEGREVHIRVQPIGIPFDEWENLARRPEVARKAQELRERVGNRTIILGVDRLDYTKGIPERMLAYEQFLRRERRRRNSYVFVQIMVPSRTDVAAYADLKDDVDRMVGDINGRFGITGRVPIHYLFRNLQRDDLLAHYRAAEVALVTPLRDGMNLVAHEYAASQVDGRGTLVLSELAGACEYFSNASLTVNPYDISAIADALTRAVRSPETERRQRMALLRDEVKLLDVHSWANSCVHALETAGR